MSNVPPELLHAEVGVLNGEQLQQLVRCSIIKNFVLNRKKDGYYKGIGGSAINLHLSNKAWRVDSTAKITQGESVVKMIRQQGGKKFGLSRTVLEKNGIYIIKLKEELAFGKYSGGYGLYGRASGRSSIGRLDVLTRLIVDYCPKYDEVPPDFSGHLYLEVIPISFNIRVDEGIELNQLRIFVGKPELSKLRAEDLGKRAPMLYKERGSPILSELDILRVDLNQDVTMKCDRNIRAFEAKNTKAVIDLCEGAPKRNPREFWKTVPFNRALSGVIINRDRFYIMRSSERMFLPHDIAVTCIAYSENLGELRIHYAGIVHPNFGRLPENTKLKDSKPGAPLTFEARCHSFKVTVRNDEPFARIEYYKMSQATNQPSGYSEQELKLSTYFRDWCNQ